MFLGENNNTYENLNKFLNKVFKHIELKKSGTLELKTEMGMPDFTTFYELQFMYKPNRTSSNNMLHTELRQVNLDDDYSIEDIVRGRVYELEKKAKTKFNNIQIKQTENTTYLHIRNNKKQ
jgi:hypothetical protein